MKYFKNSVWNISLFQLIIPPRKLSYIKEPIYIYKKKFLDERGSEFFKKGKKKFFKFQRELAKNSL